jgi:hypothetical protein
MTTPFTEGVGLRELQRHLGIGGMQRLLPPSDDDRVDVEAVLVDQVVAGELRPQVAAAQDDVSTRLCLEGEHL